MSRSGGSDDLPTLAILVNLQTASVPGFAPVGLDAERYGTHLVGPDRVPEVVAHHAATHPHVVDMSDFAATLQGVSADVDGLVALAIELGAGELVAIATDPDGGSWPIAEALLDAARSAGLRTGLALDPARDTTVLIGALAPDTVRFLGTFPAPPENGTFDAVDGPVLVTADRTLPEQSPTAPWELRLGAGPSLGWNRAETIEDLRTPRQLVDRFARAVALGGRVLLDLPIRADGTPSPLHVDALRAAAPWFTRHAATLRGFGPFDVAGDNTVRYLSRQGPDKGQRTVAIVDLDASSSRTIAHFSPHRYPILDVAGADSWSQDPSGVHLDGLADDGLPNLIFLTVTDRRLVRLSVQGRRAPGIVTIGDTTYEGIGAALAAARVGDTVVIGPGRYGPETEPYPLHVPGGVTLLGPAPPDVPAEVRKHLPEPPSAELTGSGTLLECTDANVELAHLHLIAMSEAQAPVVAAHGAHGLTIDSCTVSGRIRLDTLHDAAVRWTTFEPGGIDLIGVERATLTGGRITGTANGHASVTVDAGADVRIEAVAITDTEVAIDVRSSRAVRIGACALLARRAAVTVGRSHDIEISGNRIRAMRGVHVRDGHGIGVRMNGVERVDTFVLVEGDPLDVTVDGNRIGTARQERQTVARPKPDDPSG